MQGGTAKTEPGRFSFRTRDSKLTILHGLTDSRATLLVQSRRLVDAFFKSKKLEDAKRATSAA